MRLDHIENLFSKWAVHAQCYDVFRQLDTEIRYASAIVDFYHRSPETIEPYEYIAAYTGRLPVPSNSTMSELKHQTKRNKEQRDLKLDSLLRMTRLSKDIRIIGFLLDCNDKPISQELYIYNAGLNLEDGEWLKNKPTGSNEIAQQLWDDSMYFLNELASILVGHEVSYLEGETGIKTYHKYGSEVKFGWAMPYAVIEGENPLHLSEIVHIAFDKLRPHFERVIEQIEDPALAWDPLPGSEENFELAKKSLHEYIKVKGGITQKELGDFETDFGLDIGDNIWVYIGKKVSLGRIKKEDGMYLPKTI